MLDGEPLGAILRVPRSDDLRSNIHVGGSVVATDLTAAELAMVRAMAPRLRADGLVFVGLDVIGERLTEVNVTSPTGIQQLARFTGTRPEEKLIEWIEAADDALKTWPCPEQRGTVGRWRKKGSRPRAWCVLRGAQRRAEPPAV